jgi:hypothetical protein
MSSSFCNGDCTLDLGLEVVELVRVPLPRRKRFGNGPGPRMLSLLLLTSGRNLDPAIDPDRNPVPARDLDPDREIFTGLSYSSGGTRAALLLLGGSEKEKRGSEEECSNEEFEWEEKEEERGRSTSAACCSFCLAPCPLTACPSVLRSGVSGAVGSEVGDSKMDGGDGL